jgi:hypothetical protein
MAKAPGDEPGDDARPAADAPEVGDGLVDDDGRPLEILGEPIDPSGTVTVGAIADGLGVVAADEADLIDPRATRTGELLERLADVEDVLGCLPCGIDDVGQRTDDVVHRSLPSVGGHGGAVNPSALSHAARPHRRP